MTEAEWLASEDPARMLRVAAGRRCLSCGVLWADNFDGSVSLAGAASCGRCEPTPFVDLGPRVTSDRKLRLFALSCWRDAPPETVTHGWLEALLQLEEVAEGRREAFTRRAEGYVCATLSVLRLLLHLSGLWVGENIPRKRRRRNALAAALLLRDVVGNPFRPAATEEEYLGDAAVFDRLWSFAGGRGEPNALAYIVRSAWLTPAALSVAREMYDSRDFSAAGVLADALEDAGCGDRLILDHLRGPGPHARGCWAVDLVLGLR